jgi:hypothetical protein
VLKKHIKVSKPECLHKIKVTVQKKKKERWFGRVLTLVDKDPSFNQQRKCWKEAMAETTLGKES